MFVFFISIYKTVMVVVVMEVWKDMFVLGINLKPTKLRCDRDEIFLKISCEKHAERNRPFFLSEQILLMFCFGGFSGGGIYLFIVTKLKTASDVSRC